MAILRQLLRDPDLVNKMAAGRSTVGVCIDGTKGLPLIYSGSRRGFVPETYESR